MEGHASDDEGVSSSSHQHQSSEEAESGTTWSPPPQFFAVAQPEDEQEAALPKVTRNGKLYRKKKANLPFLKKHTWDRVPEKVNRDSETDKTKRMDKEGSPPIFERTTQVSRTLFRYLAVIVLGTLLLSRAMTETWTFGYQGRWTNAMNWIPRPVSLRRSLLPAGHMTWACPTSGD